MVQRSGVAEVVENEASFSYFDHMVNAAEKYLRVWTLDHVMAQAAVDGAK